MTQENTAADRAQNLNDAPEETTVASNESFAQDWLDAEEKERAEQTNVSSRPRLIATLPDWTAFDETKEQRKSGRNWRAALRDGKLRTTGVALAAFGLGFFCATESWRGEKSSETETGVAAVEAENGVSLESGLGEFDDSLAAIDSSTLRSFPNSAGVDFVLQTRDDANAAAVNGGFSANVNERTNNGGAANGETTSFDSLTVAQTSSANASREDESHWRRGVDFQRELTAPTDATANVDRFPTWNDLDSNVPTVDDVLNAPIETAAPVAANVPTSVGDANGWAASENVGVAQNSTAFATPSGGENAGYAAYNGGADYQGTNAANSNVAAPQFAGNSQNSGYNQTNGSENFAGWPTTVPAPTANYASTAPASAPNFASTAPASAPNFASTAPAPAPAPNFASTAPVSAPTANYASTAPVSAPNYASVAPSSTANYAPNVSKEAPRAMVAQVPNENAPVPTANVPAANPNLRW